MNEELPLGAHLVTPRGWYSHHGIHVGNGRVVHYSGFCHGLHRGPVEETSLADFTRGRGLVVRAHRKSRFGAHEIVARARSRLGENGYRLLGNNCEHFCEWCVTGNAHSEQVERILGRVRAITAATRRLAERAVALLTPPTPAPALAVVRMARHRI
jgi:hypothetical protein